MLWIMRRELLPNTLRPLVAEFGLRFSFSFLFIASLSFLGLGIQPPHADWGSMVRENASAIGLRLPAPLIPAAAVALLTIGSNLSADWLLSLSNRGTLDGEMTTDILRIEDLHVTADVAHGGKPIVNGINLSLRRAEVLGLIGESGDENRR